MANDYSILLEGVTDSKVVQLEKELIAKKIVYTSSHDRIKRRLHLRLTKVQNFNALPLEVRRAITRLGI